MEKGQQTFTSVDLSVDFQFSPSRSVSRNNSETFATDGTFAIWGAYRV